jgi:outer membrane protein assembly factor BamA
MNANRIIFFSGIIILFASCSATKGLTDDQLLYRGANVKIESTNEKMSKTTKKDFQDELEALLRPKPNSRILGMPVKLWIYNAFNPKHKSKGLGHWIQTKFGEPPVIASASALEKNRAVFQNHLENRGFFKDTVTLDTAVKNKQLTANYTATVHYRYTIRNVTFPNDTSVLSQNIQLATKRFSLLKPKQPYDLDKIKKERERIDTRLKEKGFFYFSPDDLIANVDSTVGKHKVDMDVRVKDSTPIEARQVYRIKDVVVYADYDLQSDTSMANTKVTKYGRYKIIDPNNRFQPKIFSNTLVFKPGEVYNRTDHNLSLNRLTTLGVYKFVKARFEPVDTVKGNYLNAYYYLTPNLFKTIRFQVTELTRSNNTTGTELELNWQHRNFLKGAELFTASAYGAYEKQISGIFRTNIFRYGGDLNLYVPRVIAPFHLPVKGGYVPKTRFRTAYEVYNSSAEYTLTSIIGSAGYQWKNAIKNEHQLTLVNINYVQPANITDQYKAALADNIVLQRAIERQFIIGSIYNYNYNSKNVQNYKRNNFYFNGNLDLSGNILGLATGANLAKGKQKEIFGTPFSQYFRAEVDFRHYYSLRRNRSFNTRFLAGVGYAYGNDTLMPYVKEFFAGGTTDIRAFRSRSLGPGSYYQLASDTSAGYYIDQPGDVKLELNLEYRAKLFSIVNWAAFIDMGNVWTLKKDSTRPGSQLSGNFLDQIAVGAGLGLRFDVSILVLRLDVAFPIRKPWITSGSKWDFKSIGFGDAVYNLAIGYPF